MANFRTKFNGKFSDFFLDSLRKEVAKSPPAVQVDLRETKGAEGFGIRVRKNGVITFFYMYHFNKKRRMMTLGSYNDDRNKLTLAEARLKYNAAYESVHKHKRDPLAVEAEVVEDVDTVEKVAREFLEKYAAVYYDERWQQTVKGVLERYLLPVIGHRPIQSITRRDFIPILENLLREKPGQARNLHKAASKMFWYAEDREYIPASPYTNMTKSLPDLGVPEGKERFLDDKEIVKVWQRIDRGPGDDSTKRALKFILVTGQRPEEVAEMHRREISGRWWTIPWSRIKTENKKTLKRRPQDHRVYLSDLAMTLLGSGKGYIFPSEAIRKDDKGQVIVKDEPVRRNSLSQRVTRGVSVERRKGQVIWFKHYGRPEWTPHDLRRSARTGMSRINIPKEWTRKVQNHKDGKIDSTYDQHDYDDQKKDALSRWGAHLEELLKLRLTADVSQSK